MTVRAPAIAGMLAGMAFLLAPLGARGQAELNPDKDFAELLHNAKDIAESYSSARGLINDAMWLSSYRDVWPAGREVDRWTVFDEDNNVIGVYPFRPDLITSAAERLTVEHDVVTGTGRMVADALKDQQPVLRGPDINPQPQENWDRLLRATMAKELGNAILSASGVRVRFDEKTIRKALDGIAKRERMATLTAYGDLIASARSQQEMRAAQHSFIDALRTAFVAAMQSLRNERTAAHDRIARLQREEELEDAWNKQADAFDARAARLAKALPQLDDRLAHPQASAWASISSATSGAASLAIGTLLFPAGLANLMAGCTYEGRNCPTSSSSSSDWRDDEPAEDDGGGRPLEHGPIPDSFSGDWD